MSLTRCIKGSLSRQTKMYFIFHTNTILWQHCLIIAAHHYKHQYKHHANYICFIDVMTYIILSSPPLSLSHTHTHTHNNSSSAFKQTHYLRSLALFDNSINITVFLLSTWARWHHHRWHSITTSEPVICSPMKMSDGLQRWLINLFPQPHHLLSAILDD